MKKKEIVFIRTNSVPPDSRVEKEVDCLNEVGHGVKVLAWDRDKKYKIKCNHLDLPNGKVEVFNLGIPATFGEGFKNLLPYVKFQIGIFKWLFANRKKYTIIHACDFHTAFTARICAKLLRKKLIFDIFDYLSTKPTGILGKIVKRFEDSIINKADGVIICSEQRKQQIAGTNPKKLAVIHNSPAKYIKEGEIDDKSNGTKIYRIVYVGILQDYRLLKEIGEAVGDMINVELHIGGFGKYENYFMELSKKYDNIKYYGKLSYAKTLELEQQCHIMTAIYEPSIGNHYYAAPNKFYEALMLGKPLIMVKNTGMSDIVAENEIGVLIDYSKESFKAGVTELIKQEHKWNEMSVKMKEIYDTRFSWEEMKKRLVLFYKEI